MSDIIERIRGSLKRIHSKNDEGSFVNGLLGRKNPDGSTTYVVKGMPRHKYVTLRTAQGGQTVVPARDDFGVAHSAGLPVRMKIANTVPGSGVVPYVIVGLSGREDLATVPPTGGSGVPVHIHDSLYYQKTEFIDASAGVGDAGKPIKTNADGLVDPSMVDLAGLDIGAVIHAAPEHEVADFDLTDEFPVLAGTDSFALRKYTFVTWAIAIGNAVTNLVPGVLAGAAGKTTPVDADTLPLSDSADSDALKTLSWANLKATLKTYFDTIYEAIGAVATHAALTATHGATGAVVGTTNSQTLTNKTLTTPTIADFTNAAHDHGDADDGGTLADAALSVPIHAASSKATPVDADELALIDSAASNVLKKLTWANLKATLISAFVTTSTYTPAITGGTTNPTISYTEQVGKYTTLFGVICFYGYQITINAYSGGSGELRVSLPFTAANTNTADGTRAAASFSGVDITAVGPYNLHFRVTPGQAYGSFRVGGDNIASTIPQIGDFATGDTIAASGFFWL